MSAFLVGVRFCVVYAWAKYGHKSFRAARVVPLFKNIKSIERRGFGIGACLVAKAPLKIEELTFHRHLHHVLIS